MHGKGGQTGETPVVVVRGARSRQHHHKRGDEGKEMDHQSKEPISDTTRVRTRVKQICNLTCARRARAFFVPTRPTLKSNVKLGEIINLSMGNNSQKTILNNIRPSRKQCVILLILIEDG